MENKLLALEHAIICCKYLATELEEHKLNLQAGFLPNTDAIHGLLNLDDLIKRVFSKEDYKKEYNNFIVNGPDC